MSDAVSDIPFDRDGSARFLPWLIALMVFLAALATAGALALDGALANWQRGLDGVATVELPPGSTTSEAALTALRTTKGVTSARALSRQEMAALLAPWLGTSVPDDLPLPVLIDVRIDTNAGVDLAALGTRVAAAAPGAVVDDHRLWLERLARFAHTAEATAIGIVTLIGVAAVLSVVFVTRTGLAVHRDVIELLHLVGARDFYIARQFERQALRLGLTGGAVGIVLAFATLGLLSNGGKTADVLGAGDMPLPSLILDAWQYGTLLLLPMGAALLAMATARVTVLRVLSRMP